MNDSRLYSRRAFLRRGACAALGTTGLLTQLANLRMLGATTSLQSAMSGPGDYKALVCIYLYGGNDSNNVLIPNDPAGYAAYAQARQFLALPKESLLGLTPLNGDGRSFGMNPALTELRDLFQQQKVAVLANVGALAAPVTRAQYFSGYAPLPQGLFSHNDQEIEWQTSLPTPTRGSGWGGRVADLLHSLNSNPSISMSISLAGNNSFQRSNLVHQFQASVNGSVGLRGQTGQAANLNREQALRGLLAYEHQHLFEDTYTDLTNKAIEADLSLRGALEQSQVSTAFPINNPLAPQLKMVARLIKAAPLLGMRRQIFFCAMGGFDLHDMQLNAHSRLLSQVSQAMRSFYDATVEIGAANSVTTFTASDFGRTYATNGKGSDHGWGGHHLIMGGAVQGGRFYGNFPQLVVDGPDDTSQGRWIPTTSVDQYSATLARWFGVSESDIPTVIPNIGRFAASNLGFMG